MALWELHINDAGDTLIVTPQTDLHTDDVEGMDAGADEVLRCLDELSIKNVILDFGRTDYFNSDALGVFVKLWKQVGQRNARLVFCNVSVNQAEILRVTRLDRLWSLSPCRETALRSLQGELLNESAS